MDIRFIKESKERAARFTAMHRSAIDELFETIGGSAGNVSCVASQSRTSDVKSVTVVFWGNYKRQALEMRAEALALSESCNALVMDTKSLRKPTAAKPFGSRVHILLPMPTAAQLRAPLAVEGEEDIHIDWDGDSQSEHAPSAMQLEHRTRFATWNAKSAKKMEVGQVVDIRKDFTEEETKEHEALLNTLQTAMGVTYLLYAPMLDMYFTSYDLFKTAVYGLYHGTFARFGGLQLFAQKDLEEEADLLHCCEHNADDVASVLDMCYRAHGDDVLAKSWCMFGIRSNAKVAPLSEWHVYFGDGMIPFIETAKYTETKPCGVAVVHYAEFSNHTGCWYERAFRANQVRRDHVSTEDDDINDDTNVLAQVCVAEILSQSSNDGFETTPATEIQASEPVSTVEQVDDKATAPLPASASGSTSPKRRTSVVKRAQKKQLKVKQISKKAALAKKRKREQQTSIGVNKRRKLLTAKDAEWNDLEFATRATRDIVEQDRKRRSKGVGEDAASVVVRKSLRELQREKQLREEVTIPSSDYDREFDAATGGVAMFGPRDEFMGDNETVEDAMECDAPVVEESTGAEKTREENSDDDDDEDTDGEEEACDDESDRDKDRRDGDSDDDGSGSPGNNEESSDSESGQDGDSDHDEAKEHKDSDQDGGGDTGDTECADATLCHDGAQSSAMDVATDDDFVGSRGGSETSSMLEGVLTTQLINSTQNNAALSDSRAQDLETQLQLSQHMLHTMAQRVNDLTRVIPHIDGEAAALANAVNNAFKGDQGRPSNRIITHLSKLNGTVEEVVAACLGNGVMIQGLAKNYQRVMEIVAQLEQTIQRSVDDDGAGVSDGMHETAGDNASKSVRGRVTELIAETQAMVKGIDMRVTMMEVNAEQEARMSILSQQRQQQFEALVERVDQLQRKSVQQEQQIELLQTQLEYMRGMRHITPKPAPTQQPRMRIRFMSGPRESDKKTDAPPLPAMDGKQGATTEMSGNSSLVEDSGSDTSSPCSSTSYEDHQETHETELDMNMLQESFGDESMLFMDPLLKDMSSLMDVQPPKNVSRIDADFTEQCGIDSLFKDGEMQYPAFDETWAM